MKLAPTSVPLRLELVGVARDGEQLRLLLNPVLFTSLEAHFIEL